MPPPRFAEQRLRGGHPWIYRTDVADARAQAYEGIAMISFPGAQWRRDIAADR